MQITIYGCGYVGLVTGACLAEIGHDVLCIDIDASKVAKLRQAQVAIHEPGLQAMVAHNIHQQRLSFTTDYQAAVDHGLVQIIAVNTPTQEDGSANLNYVFSCAESIAQRMSEYRLIINKSTSPVGTAQKIRRHMQQVLQQRYSEVEFDVASNPEFLKEGLAVQDFMQPDRIIIGTDNEKSKALLQTLYAKLTDANDCLLAMSIPSAELTKYAANAMLATKISFINQIANIAEQVSADIEQVREGMSLDPRIGPHFLASGCGYGGSCLPKDVKALAYNARELGVNSQLLDAVDAVNERQKSRLFNKIYAYHQGDLQGKTFALWGLAFKPNTNDLRQASSEAIMQQLWGAGAKVIAHDPVAMPEAKAYYGERDDLAFEDDPLDALTEADGLIVVTEWQQYREIAPIQIRDRLLQKVIFDGRNIFDPAIMTELNLDYFAMGRGMKLQRSLTLVSKGY